MIKQLHYFKSWLLLMLCIFVGVGSASADTVTFTAGTDTSEGTSITKGGITVSFSSGVFNRTDNYRCYSGASMTISSTVGKITQIDFTATSSNPMTKFSGNPDVGAWTDALTKTQWKGDAAEINFGTTSGQARITEIVVTYTAASSSPLASISVDGAESTFHVGDEFTHAQAVVTATYEDESTADVTANATFSTPDMTTAGEKEVEVSYTEGEVTETDTYTINVLAPATLDRIELSGSYPDEFSQGDEFSHEGMMVTAWYDDDSSEDVTADATFSGYDMNTVGEQTVTVTYEGKTEEYTITVNAPVTHNVTWSVNGTITSDSYQENATITFPTDPADIEGKSFVGWTTAEISGTTDEAPTFVTSATMGNADITYYAVFAEMEETSGIITKTYSFETETDADWTIDGPARSSEKANTGDYSGKINTNNTYVTFNNKVKATEFSFAFTRTSNNNNYNVYVETSTDNQTWTAAETYAMSTFSNGTFDTKTKEFDGNTELYVRFHCYNTTAVRYVDDITIKYNGTTIAYSAYCTTVVADTRQNPELTFSETEVEGSIGQDFTAPTLSAATGFNGTVEYESSDESVAQIMDQETGEIRLVGEGTATITATFAGNDDFKAGSASYTLTVTDNRIETTITNDNISLGLTEVATLTRLAPVVKDANDNVVAYTYGEWPTEVSFEIVSDENSIIGSLDNNSGEITLNSVEGTATLKAFYNYFNVNSTYKPSECTFTITVVDQDAVVFDFVKVTSNSQIAVGREYIIVYEGNGTRDAKVLDGLDGSNGKPVAVTINNDGKISSDNLSMIYTLGGTSEGYSLMDTDSKYLKAKAAKKLELSETEATEWIVSSTDDGYVLENTNSTYGTLQYNYNSGNDRFLNYTSAQEAAVLYVKELPEITLTDDNESNNSAIIAANDGEKVSVTVERTLSSEYYNTLYLPFAMSAAQITAAFGEGVQVATYTSTSGTTFIFSNVTEMAANTGYLVKPAATVEGFTVSGVTIENAADATAADGDSMFGTYDGFDNDDTRDVYYFTTAGKMKKLAANGSIKGLRSFMVTDKSTSAREFSYVIGEDVVTGINAIDNGQLTIDNDAPAYNLAGQRVGKNYKGIVIVNGKKYIK